MPSKQTPEGGWKWDGRFPHCDHRIVHKPGECAVCDEYAPMLQYLRHMWNINYTGHHDIQNERGDTMLPCPAEVARPLRILNKWYGNTAKPVGWDSDNDKLQESQTPDDQGPLQSN